LEFRLLGVGCRGASRRFTIDGDISTGRSSGALSYDRLIFDPLMRSYYGTSQAYNVGYWGLGAKTQAEASRDLMLYLLPEAFVPDSNPPVRILDVACGLGETTGYLQRRWPHAEVTGINFSADQIAACRQTQPACRFEVMDATELRFAGESFDLIVCVEAAMHFQTRRAFLTEVYRVLKPGGKLVLSDMLFAADSWLSVWHVPPENHLLDLTRYRALLEESGFTATVMEDRNEECWKGFCRNMGDWLDRPEQTVPHAAAAAAWRENLTPLRGAIAHYPLIWARKGL